MKAPNRNNSGRKAVLSFGESVGQYIMTVGVAMLAYVFCRTYISNGIVPLYEAVVLVAVIIFLMLSIACWVFYALHEIWSDLHNDVA